MAARLKFCSENVEVKPYPHKYDKFQNCAEGIKSHKLTNFWSIAFHTVSRTPLIAPKLLRNSQLETSFAVHVCLNMTQRGKCMEMQAET